VYSLLTLVGVQLTESIARISDSLKQYDDPEEKVIGDKLTNITENFRNACLNYKTELLERLGEYEDTYASKQVCRNSILALACLCNSNCLWSFVRNEAFMKESFDLYAARSPSTLVYVHADPTHICTLQSYYIPGMLGKEEVVNKLYKTALKCQQVGLHNEIDENVLSARLFHSKWNKNY
jgi:hypothetical protein